MATLHPKHILVADDDETMQSLISFQLMSWGYRHIMTAADGLEALSRLQSHIQFGLIITDLNMPRMGGAELIRQVQNDPLRQQVPIIMVSEPTPGQAEELRHFLRQRNVSFVPKSQVVGAGHDLLTAIRQIELRLA